MLCFVNPRISTNSLSLFITVISKDKTVTVQPYYRSGEFQEAKAARFRDSRHLNVVRLTALQTGRFYASGCIPGTHFC